MTLLLAADVPDDERRQWIDALSRELPGERWVEARDPSVDPAIDVAIVANPPAGSLAGLRGLKLIQSLWAGVDRLLDDSTLPDGVPIARMVDPAMNKAMAETALWAVLSLQRDFFAYARDQRAGRWVPREQRRADEFEVAVLGLGQMGRTVARALVGAGHRVSGWSSRPSEVDGVRCVAGDAALAPLLGGVDAVVNLLPLTDATRGMFDARLFACLRRGAGFVNLARGAHVVDADLLAALASGQVGQAVLDVYGAEPLPAAHPFWSHERVAMLPHVAAQTDYRSAAAVAAENVRALREGRPLAHAVDRRRGY